MTPTELSDERCRFVLSQHDLYGVLAARVVDMRKALDGGTDLADVLVAETKMVLDSGMTREQVASALVSVLARVAQGVDLFAEERPVLTVNNDELIVAFGDRFSDQAWWRSVDGNGG